MNNRDESTVVQNLIDAGCDENTIADFMQTIRQGKESEGLRILQLHRRFLLNQLHDEQKKIDCLDYLVYNISKKDKIS
jgi:protein tyrosine/serine phosphatase